MYIYTVCDGSTVFRSSWMLPQCTSRRRVCVASHDVASHDVASHDVASHDVQAHVNTRSGSALNTASCAESGPVCGYSKEATEAQQGTALAMASRRQASSSPS